MTLQANRPHLLGALMATILFFAQTAGATSTGPVAVMPFKNLSGQTDLDWLRVGMAETLIADLQKAGGRPVVERDQIDKALAEIALQSESAGSDEALAARAGKLVGATTVVLGAFQTAGGTKNPQLRLTARFVNVESGVIEETAKVTGRVGEVFALQDQIVARLLGKAPPKKRPAKSSSQKKAVSAEATAEAFHAYSLSLSTSSAVERIRYLKEAIELDPDFHYASDDLAALQTRLKGHRRNDDDAVDSKTQELLVLLRDPTRTAEDNAHAVTQAFRRYSNSYRWESLRRLAEVVYELHLPAAGGIDPHESASYNIFLAHLMLKQADLALQAGERHVKTFPGGTFTGMLSGQIENLIQAQHRDRQARVGIDADLQDVANDEAKLTGKEPNLAWRRRMFAFRRCAIHYGGRGFEGAIRLCTSFATEYGPDPADGDNPLDRMARYFAAISKAELGRFEEARADMNVLVDEDADWARKMAVQSFLSMWPRD